MLFLVRLTDEQEQRLLLADHQVLPIHAEQSAHRHVERHLYSTSHHKRRTAIKSGNAVRYDKHLLPVRFDSDVFLKETIFNMVRAQHKCGAL